jgi:four helix bundle protein
MSYKKFEIWQDVREIVIDLHRMSLSSLPKFEMFEEGSQIRRSSKSIKSNIVEGYGRKKYKQEYIKFLTYSISSNDETIDHLENLYETGSLKDENHDFQNHKLYPNFHYPVPSTQYPVPSTQHPAPSTQYPAPSTQYPEPDQHPSI